MKEAIADIINYIDTERDEIFSQVVLSRVREKLQKLMNVLCTPTSIEPKGVDGELSTDELLKRLECVKYKSFGFPMVMLWRVVDSFHDKWECRLRNDQNWKEAKDLEGATPREALQKLYDYCIEKGYLPQRPIELQSAQVSDTTDDAQSVAADSQNLLKSNKL